MPDTPKDSSEATAEELHRFVCDLALSAGELQLSRYERPGEIQEKAPKDLVTEVDFLCEELLISRIQERYPDDNILSEERGGETSSSGRSWLLDPLDGTANFSRANPMFCCCVSVAENDRITHAAVAAPRLGDLYHARLGGGAYRDSDGQSQPLTVSATEQLEYAFTGADVGFIRQGNKPESAGLLEVFARSWQLRALGSAGIRGAWLAAGYIDVSVGTRNTAWDYAPTALLVSEAGGTVTDLSGEPWSYESGGMIASNGLVHDEVLQTLDENRPT